METSYDSSSDVPFNRMGRETDRVNIGTGGYRSTLQDRSIQSHLVKKYRKEAYRWLKIALEQSSYEDVNQVLQEFVKWRRESMNPLPTLSWKLLGYPRTSSAQGCWPAKKDLDPHNPIESMFSTVRDW